MIPVGSPRRSAAFFPPVPPEDDGWAEEGRGIPRFGMQIRVFT